MITRKNHQKHENDTKDKWEQVHVRLKTTTTTLTMTMIKIRKLGSTSIGSIHSGSREGSKKKKDWPPRTQKTIPKSDTFAGTINNPPNLDICLKDPKHLNTKKITHRCITN